VIAQLTIQNYGLIDRLVLEFGPGLTVLTGETGAGKSILIGALRFALGERVSGDPLREPSESCTVEAIFELPREFLDENEGLKDYIKDGEPLIVQRTYTPDGKSKIKLNGFSLTLGQLKEIGNLLVDFHGPNDHQMLLAPESHVRILDRLSKRIAPLKDTHADLFDESQKIEHALKEIRESVEVRERELDLLGHQIRELERVSLEKRHYEETLEKETQLKNHEKLYENAKALVELFESEESGLGETARKAFPFVRVLAAIDKSAGALAEKTENLQILSEEILSELRRYEESLAFDPEEARELAQRCDAYHGIIRKFGPTIEDAAAFYKKAKERHDFLVNLENNDSALRQKQASFKKALKDSASKITKERKKTGELLVESIEKELKDLGIAHVRFECRLNAIDPRRDGADEVVFYISPNLGEELKPLSEIVSSGEAARVMLALKKSLTNVDPIPVLIFDEIDAQIGGRLGGVIGEKLGELAQDRQVILITHLPQIAGFAERHFKVSKKVSEGRTMTRVDLLERSARVDEMAQMMSGDKESGLSRSHAEEMLERGQKQGRPKSRT